jgi:hypothetical protein
MFAAESSNVKTSPLGINPFNPNYVTGFCEAQSTFTYLRNGGGVNLRFSLKVSDADKNLVFALQNYFRSGSIYHTGAGWMYCATSLASIENIVAHFDAFPMAGKKNQEYQIWRKMFHLKRIPRKADTAELLALAQELSSLRTKIRPSKPLEPHD